MTNPCRQVTKCSDRFERHGDCARFWFIESDSCTFKQSGCVRSRFGDVATSVQGTHLHHVL